MENPEWSWSVIIKCFERQWEIAVTPFCKQQVRNKHTHSTFRLYVGHSLGQLSLRVLRDSVGSRPLSPVTHSLAFITFSHCGHSKTALISITIQNSDLNTQAHARTQNDSLRTCMPHVDKPSWWSADSTGANKMQH